ncbi:MAG: NAD(P)/FAD-dependent oxidoreductase [Anaerolineae bacterium]|nr:NAD(P)/FAD-dependent oxidoreductase [Anaerolineae bacterium]
MPNYVIVGNGVAGVTAAQAIARADSSASVQLIGSEPYPYYQRPRLWAWIAGEIEEQDLFFRPVDWYATQGIQLRLGACVTELDLQAHALSLSDGTTLAYDRLLLATGGVPFVPPIAGANVRGVFTLRTLEDARAIKAYAEQVDRVLVLGGGLLGLETARALLGPKRDVYVLEIFPYLLPRQLDAPGAAVLRRRLEAIGLRFYVGKSTEAILGDGHVQGVRLSDGAEIAGDMALLSTGIRSKTDLARAAGLEVARGVVVNGHLQTSAPDVYAAGDVAEFEGRVYGIIPAAIEQARMAAANMVGSGRPLYAGTVPSTTLKIVGIDLTCLGESTVEGDEYTIARYSDEDNGIYKRLTFRGNVVVGAILLGDTTEARSIQRLIAERREVAAYGERLIDGSLDLSALARGTAPA